MDSDEETSFFDNLEGDCTLVFHLKMDPCVMLKRGTNDYFNTCIRIDGLSPTLRIATAIGLAGVLSEMLILLKMSLRFLGAFDKDGELLRFATTACVVCDLSIGGPTDKETLDQFKNVSWLGYSAVPL